ncbi:hypothetical protein FSP39_013810 [Pinctada imbricata]|uniref:Protein kinase domain-containing protein n=1 Tax=Pinctada imbricata TaxID=66713 RepID=A0AA88YJ66_PINIB|nr:hypothetical protein FSP39_013810 [Pinctada imbricata]
MVRNQGTNGNEQIERRRDSLNNVYLTGGRDARMDDSPRHRRLTPRKRCLSHNDASEIEQPISWHVKGSCQQTKQPHAEFIQKDPYKAPRRRSKSQSDSMDELPEPQKLDSIRPKVKEKIKELEGNFQAFTEEEHVHLNSDELFWSGKSGYSDLSRYQIEAPEQTDCPQCLRLMLSALHLSSHQLPRQLKSDGKLLDVNLYDLIRLQLERQEPAAYSDERPCYHYSVVQGEKTMIKRFLTCLFHGHLEHNCGILLKDELGNIARHKGKFREGHEYRMLKVLGQGTYGVVHLCEIITSSGNGFEFVIKEIKADAFNEEEIEIPLEHGNGCQQILEIYGIIKRGDKILLVMEYARGGTLSSLKVGRDITFKDFITVTFNLLGGIQYLHNAGICLYDIKDSNELAKVLVTWDSVILFTTFVSKGTSVRQFIQDKNFNYQIQPYIQSSSGYYLKEKTTRRNALDIVDDIELELILVN